MKQQKQKKLTIGKLIAKLPPDFFRFSGELDTPIEWLAWDYTKVTPNTMYFCLEEEEFQEGYFKGNALHHYFDAISNGAICLVAERGRITELPDHIQLLEVNRVNEAMAMIGKEFYGDPFRSMHVIGVTGTNGKTTTSRFLDAIFQHSGEKPGIIGTVGVFLPSGVLPNEPYTTPLALDLFAFGEKMKEEGVKTVIMEVTSHGIALQRILSIDYDVGVFTNLTQDHLDFHHNFEAYKAAKLAFFQKMAATDNKNAFCVINMDDSAGIDVQNAFTQHRSLEQRKNIVTYGIRNQEVDLLASPKKMSGGASEFELFFHGNSLGTVHLPQPGIFNIYNALAAFSAAYAVGVPIATIVKGLEKISLVTGRFERVPYTTDFDVYIDYAHTPDSLENILRAVREICHKKLIVIFGCGGDRDKSKRPVMGRIADALADITIVTSDNPRTEEPKTIIEEVLTGISDISNKLGNTLFVEEDRKKAIHLSLQTASSGDAIVIAGKGHEMYQIIGKNKIPFSDRKVVESYFQLIRQKDRRAWIEISTPNLRHNFSLINQDKPQGLKILTVVKDNATGHGALLVANEAIRSGSDYLGVACLSEAIQLRESGIHTHPILVFGERGEEELPLCFQYDLSIQIQSIEKAELVARLSNKEGKTIPLHFKVDTGMGRYGIRWTEALSVLRSIRSIEGLFLEGIMTHFAQSDEADKHYANLQWNRFESLLEQLKSENLLPPLIHSCNTGGYLDLPHAHGNMVRTGILPLGVYPSKVCRRIIVNGEALSPVMTVKTRVAFVKKLLPGDSLGYGMHFTAKTITMVAVLPFGYGDGYPRFRNKGKVLVHGKQASIIGGNSMDATMIDVTDIDNIEAGDEVVILGKQGEEEITATMIADWCGTVCYDILNRWLPRMERIIL